MHRVKHNIWYAAGFTGDTLRVDLHIGHRQPSKSQWLFDQLRDRQRVVESALGFGLEWESPAEPGTNAGRLAVYRPDTIYEDPEHMAELQAWAVDMIISLRAGLTSHLDELLR